MSEKDLEFNKDMSIVFILFEVELEGGSIGIFFQFFFYFRQNFLVVNFSGEVLIQEIGKCSQWRLVYLWYNRVGKG